MLPNQPQSTFSTNVSVRPTLRRGLATVEFVFALPMLLLLMVGLTWLGTSVIRQAQVSIEARHGAWSKRFDPRPSQVFAFSRNSSDQSADDFVSGSASVPVHVSKSFDQAAAPRAEQLVMAGTWDDASLPLDSAPNWDAYRQALSNAGIDDLQNVFSGLDDFRGTIRDVGARFLANQLGLSNALDGISSNASSQQSGQAAQQRREHVEEKLQRMQRRQVLESEIAELRKKQLLSALTAAEDRKLFRLNAELADVNEALRELNNLGPLDN